ncbi:hypothetical protein BH11PSE9_BH11PSE9_37890 [soil metagenome]
MSKQRRRRRIDSERTDHLKWAAILLAAVGALWFGLMTWALS